MCDVMPMSRTCAIHNRRVADDVRCFHSHPPLPPIRDLDEGETVRGVVVCVHVFGLGVWLPDAAQFGHVNVTHMGVPETHTLDDYPGAGASLTARVLGYSGAQHQLRLQVIDRPLTSVQIG
jgi:hypothetical protein